VARASYDAPGPAPFREADFPAKPTGFLNMLGPGAVLVGLAIGGGELIVWPILTARFGAAIVWAAMLGVALQLAINIEVGRYTLATGESAYAGFARLSRHWIPVFLVLNVFGWLLPAWARTCAGALKALIVGPEGPGDPWAWTALTFALAGLVLFGPRNVYRTIERVTIALISLMLVGLTIIAIKIGTPEAVGDLAHGILNVGFKPADLPTYELFSAIVFAGAGGTTNLMFSYYLIAKGWGMGGVTASGRVSAGGFAPPDSPQNRSRWRAWFAHTRGDQVLFFWIANSLTILLFVFAALVVLHAEGIVPSREMLVWQEAAILERVWGLPGAYLFLLVGIACLFSTQLTLLDGVARSGADLLHTNYPAARKRPVETWRRDIAIAWMVLGTLLTWAWGHLPPFMFLLSAGFFGGIAMAVYCPLLAVINRRLIPDYCRASGPWFAVFCLISAFYVVFAVVSLWVIAGRLIGG
jgi:hypothetical protein